jgi:hypothetical protein
VTTARDVARDGFLNMARSLLLHRRDGVPRDPP